MSRLAASPSRQRNAWREGQEPGLLKEELSRAEPSQAGLQASERARDPAPSGTPGPPPPVDFIQGIVGAGPGSPSTRNPVYGASPFTQPGLTNGAHTRGVSSSPEILTPPVSSLLSWASAGATIEGPYHRRAGAAVAAGNGPAARVSSRRPQEQPGTIALVLSFRCFFGASLSPASDPPSLPPGRAPAAGSLLSAPHKTGLSLKNGRHPRLCFAHLFSLMQGLICGSEMTLLTRDMGKKRANLWVCTRSRNPHSSVPDSGSL